MGGKNKQAQRTKNNARPSSSCRSAELLGSSFPQFVSFSRVKESGLVLPAFSLPSDDLDSCIDSNFQLVLKKMNKKDSTTKLKALNEFTDLLKNTEIEAVKAVLPFWPRLYYALATDTDHKVREATHIAHHEMALKAKRNLAPFLKQLIGPWFTSQYDTYAPAASAATKAFQDAFPQSKMQEVIIFCQEEILLYIYDNLIVHTVQTLSNPKSTSPEEAEAKYQRVLISSLGGYSLYLQTTSKEQIEKELELNLKILSNSKFWKLAKHKVAPIKAAWFSVISALCQKSPLLMEKEAAHLVGTVFTNLDEVEPTVLSSVWEAGLSILHAMPEWWKYVNVEKLILPKLWKILKDGGQGNATLIFPNLLPLLSHLPQITDILAVYCTFFENMRSGLKQKSVLMSRSESLATSVAFLECFQYVIMKNQNDIVFCEKLIKLQLFPLLEWSLTDTQASSKNIFNQVSKLIQYWNRNISNQNFPNCIKYINYFWNNMTSLFEGLLLNLEHNYEKNVVSQLASRQIELLQSLKHISKPRKQLKVTFDSENVSENTETADNYVTNMDMDKQYFNSLNSLVYKTCENYVKYINSKQTKELIEYLACLIRDFESESFLYHLNLQFSEGKKTTNLIEIYRGFLLNWLKNHNLCSKPVVELIFIFFKYLNEEEKMEILNSFNQINEECFSWCVAQVLSHPHNEDSIIHNWFNNDRINNFLIKIVEKEITDTSTSELSLILKQSFMEKPNGELFLCKKTVSNIIKILSKSLLQPTDYSLTLDMCASFAAYISAILYTSNFKLFYGEELLLAMISLSCSFNIDPDTLSEDTLWEVNTAWQDAICILTRELSFDEFKILTLKCANIIEKMITNNVADVPVDNLANFIVNFIKCLQINNPLRIFDVLNLFLHRDFVSASKEALTKTCIFAEYIKGYLCNPYEELIEKPEDIKESNIIHYFAWMDLTAQVFTKPIQSPVEDEDIDDNADITTVIELAGIDEVKPFILELTYALTLAKIFIKNYSNIKCCIKIKANLNTLKEKVKYIFKNIDDNSIENLEFMLKQKVLESSWLWVWALHLFNTDFATKDLSEVYVDVIKTCDIDKSQLSILHLTQVFASNINYDHIYNKLSPIQSIIIMRSLIKCDDLDVVIAETFSKIDHMKHENPSQFMYERMSPWNYTEMIIECIRFYSVILKYKPHCIQLNRWDSIIVSLATWYANVTKQKCNVHFIQVKSFIAALSELFLAVNEYVQKCDNENIISEWKDVFASDIHKDIVEMWLYFSDQYQDKSNSFCIADEIFLQEFGKALYCLEYLYLFEKKHQNLPKWSKLLKQSCSLISNSINTLQLWGYHMLLALLPGLLELDSLAVKNNTPHEKGLIFEQFKDVLCSTQEIIQSMLLDFRLGEHSCKVEPFTDSYTYTFAYLSIWDILLKLCELSSTELRYQYADWLKNGDFIYNLLNNIFKLMPIEIMHNTEAKVKFYIELFTNKFSVLLTDEYSSERIEHMVCWIFASTLSQLPAIVRQWWSYQETRTAQIVEKVTATFVSPQLCNQELIDVAQHETKFKNMVVKVYPNVREVIAVYTVDEAQMELLITLPSNYPLGGPEVQCNRQICGTSHRQWLMQLRICVLHQNGRIWDGLSMWNNNLDKKFDGVEECYICFAVLHHGTYQLPKLICQTCKKKFHSACLYKWFSTSNKSTCPICRNLF